MWNHGEQVVWHRHGVTGKDSYNRPILGFVDEPLENVVVAPGSSSESRSTSNPSRLSTQMSIFLIRDPGVTDRDEFTVRGRRYEVDGDVEGSWTNPFSGSSFGTEINLKKVSG